MGETVVSWGDWDNRAKPLVVHAEGNLSCVGNGSSLLIFSQLIYFLFSCTTFRLLQLHVHLLMCDFTAFSCLVNKYNFDIPHTWHFKGCFSHTYEVSVLIKQYKKFFFGNLEETFSDTRHISIAETRQHILSTQVSWTLTSTINEINTIDPWYIKHHKWHQH